MIIVFGNHVQNDDISSNLLLFKKILISWIFRRVKEQKNGTKLQKTLSAALHILFSIHHMMVTCGTQV